MIERDDDSKISHPALGPSQNRTKRYSCNHFVPLSQSRCNRNPQSLSLERPLCRTALCVASRGVGGHHSTIGLPPRACCTCLHGFHIAVGFSRRPAIVRHRHEPPGAHGHGRRSRRRSPTGGFDDEPLYARLRRRAAFLWTGFRSIWPQARRGARLCSVRHRCHRLRVCSIAANPPDMACRPGRRRRRPGRHAISGGLAAIEQTRNRWQR